MTIEGCRVRLRAVEPADAERMYRWENDPTVWSVSGTTEPFSLFQMQQFAERQYQGDICRDGQLRLIIETCKDLRAIGTIDLFEYDPVNSRAGVGILIYEKDDRGQGYASDALRILCRYACRTLRLHQLWCNVGADNQVSLQLFLQAGFTTCGTKRDWLWHDERYHDEVMMQRLLE